MREVKMFESDLEVLTENKFPHTTQEQVIANKDETYAYPDVLSSLDDEFSVDKKIIRRLIELQQLEKRTIYEEQNRRKQISFSTTTKSRKPRRVCSARYIPKKKDEKRYEVAKPSTAPCLRLGAHRKQKLLATNYDTFRDDDKNISVKANFPNAELSESLEKKKMLVHKKLLEYRIKKHKEMVQRRKVSVQNHVQRMTANDKTYAEEVNASLRKLSLAEETKGVTKTKRKARRKYEVVSRPVNSKVLKSSPKSAVHPSSLCITSRKSMGTSITDKYPRVHDEKDIELASDDILCVQNEQISTEFNASKIKTKRCLRFVSSSPKNSERSRTDEIKIISVDI